MMDRYWRNDFLDATKFDNGWVLVVWVNNEVGYLSKNFIKTLRMIEKKIVEDGLQGWFCASEPQHVKMHEIIKKFGCEYYLFDEGMFWFRKFLGGEPCVEAQSEASSQKSVTLQKA